MTNLEKLKVHIKEIDDILNSACVSFRIVDCLHNLSDKLERIIVHQNQFLRYTSITHWRILIIELHKLYSKDESDKFSLYAFAKLAKSEYSSLIADEDVLFWLKHLHSVKKKSDNVRKLRNGVYAHTDENWKKIENKLTLKDINNLLGIAQHIVDSVYTSTFDRPSSIRIFYEPDFDLKRTIKSLTNERRIWLHTQYDEAIRCGINPADIGMDMELLNDKSK